MPVKRPKSRRTERKGVNATQSFFESQDCVFLEVSQQNDFGKDAYIDIGLHGEITHLCAALQIKSGTSYRSNDGDYYIPLREHAENWRRSTVPVFGIVYDPEDGLLRWADLTGYLRAHSEQNSGSIKVSKATTLDATSLHKDFSKAISAYARDNGNSIALRLLGDDIQQSLAVLDAWALGRKDAQFLILLRRLIADLGRDAVRQAIHALSHVCHHPDILFTSRNWFPPEIQLVAQRSFRWYPAEVAHMLSAVPSEEYGRGTLGQSLDVLLRQDPDISLHIDDAIGLLLSEDLSAAMSGAALALSYAHDARDKLRSLVSRYPDLLEEQYFSEVAAVVEEYGYLSLY